jgi:hypothetical protein
MPIQDYFHVRFCGVFTALNDDKAFAIRGEGIVRILVRCQGEHRLPQSGELIGSVNTTNLR